MEAALSFLGGLSDDTIWYSFMMLYPGSGLSKCIPGAMDAMWPTMPAWSWPLIGAGELYASYLFHTGELAQAHMLLSIFMGGVLCSIVALPGAKGTVALVETKGGILGPYLFGSSIVYEIGRRNGGADSFFMLQGIGFAIGMILSTLFGRSAPKKKD